MLPVRRRLSQLPGRSTIRSIGDGRRRQPRSSEDLAGRASPAIAAQPRRHTASHPSADVSDPASTSSSGSAARGVGHAASATSVRPREAHQRARPAATRHRTPRRTCAAELAWTRVADAGSRRTSMPADAAGASETSHGRRRQHVRAALPRRVDASRVSIVPSRSATVRRTPGISCERPIRSTLVSFIPLFGGPLARCRRRSAAQRPALRSSHLQCRHARLGHESRAGSAARRRDAPGERTAPSTAHRRCTPMRPRIVEPWRTQPAASPTGAGCLHSQRPRTAASAAPSVRRATAPCCRRSVPTRARPQRELAWRARDTSAADADGPAPASRHAVRSSLPPTVRRTPGISCERPICSTLVSFIPLFGGSSYSCTAGYEQRLRAPLRPSTYASITPAARAERTPEARAPRCRPRRLTTPAACAPSMPSSATATAATRVATSAEAQHPQSAAGRRIGPPLSPRRLAQAACRTANADAHLALAASQPLSECDGRRVFAPASSRSALPPDCPPNTGDKLRASNTLNARQLHPLVRRPRPELTLANVSTCQACGLPGRLSLENAPPVYCSTAECQKAIPSRFASDTRTTHRPGNRFQSRNAA